MYNVAVISEKYYYFRLIYNNERNSDRILKNIVNI